MMNIDDGDGYDDENDDEDQLMVIVCNHFRTF